MSNSKFSLRALALSVSSLALVGCATPGGTSFEADRHRPHYAPFEQRVRLDAAVPLAAQADAALAGAPRAALRVRLEHGPALPAERRAELFQHLLRAGLPAAQITVAASGAGDEVHLVLIRDRAHASGRAGLEQRAADGKWYASGGLDSRYGCSVNGNLAAQLERPEDAQGGGTLDAQNPVRAVSAVEAYQRGKVRELSEPKMEAGGGGSGPM